MIFNPEVSLYNSVKTDKNIDIRFAVLLANDLFLKHMNISLLQDNNIYPF